MKLVTLRVSAAIGCHRSRGVHEWTPQLRELSSRFSAIGICDLEVLSEHSGLVFCRGWRDSAEGNRNGVLVVLPGSEQPTSATLNRLEHESSLENQLDSAWAVRPLQLLRDRGQTILVLEDPGGEVLGGLLGTRMGVEQFLRLAADIAAVLGKVHQQGLIHKDIKPANILVNTAGGEVRLTGFGIASRLTREKQSVEPPELIDGTLAYMAPEQTGRMNRSIDSRSDLYSFGVTLYEMLTGSLPFTASDPMEWVHCHIARRADSPSERVSEIPEALSSIVMKLLAKTVEERYQTAGGVEADLRRCLVEWQLHGRIEAFSLAVSDTPDRLLIPERLYGREREIATLLATFDRVVAQGASELILISGYSGIGKSTLVNQLYTVLFPSHGLFAAGKFDQYKRDFPYSTLAQAFQRLIGPILTKSEAELGHWRKILLDALEPHGNLIVDLVPELKFIIGEQEPVPELPASDAKRRMQLLLRRFIGVFARPEHPLALFLDDLQWLDAATLDLLEDLLTQGSVPHLLLIGAYRDNEVDASHPLMRKLTSIKAAGTSSVHQITLGPLDVRHVSHLIADALRCETDRVADLARMIFRKTDGNPFFINQFLSTLADEGLISFDSEHSRWSWDLQLIHAKGYTDNVADLMIGKLVRLPAKTQEALQQLACLGNIATSAMLAVVHNTTEQQLHAALMEARRLEFVDFLESSYRFVHDRVQEAAYALIPIERRAAMHLRLGKMLVAHTPPGELDGAIFEILNQLNRASSLILAPEEREQLAEFNLLAGKRAQTSSAYVSALNYLTAGAALLTEDSWQHRGDLCFALDLGRAHCEFASGTIAEAEKRLRSLSIRAVTTAERAAVACLQVDLYLAIDRGDEAIAVGLRGLRDLGVDFPERPTEVDVRHAYDDIWMRLGTRPIEDLVELPLMSDPDSLAAMDLLSRIGVPAFYNSFHLGAVAVFKAISLGLERGHSEASCIAYAQLGLYAGPHFGQFDAGDRFGRLGCELSERPGLQRFQSRAYRTFGFVASWTQHVRKGRELLFRAFDLASRIGEISFAGNACSHLTTNYLMGGDPLIDAQRQAESGLALAHKTGFGFLRVWISGQLGLIRSLRGLTIRFGSFDDDVFRESDLEHELAGNPALALPGCWYYIRKLQALFFAGEYVDALQAAVRAQPMLSNSVTLLEIVEYRFYDALCHAALHASASCEDRRDHHARLMEHLEQLDTWTLHCPENFANRASLVGAELARIEGREVDAMRLYEHAIRAAREQGFVQNEALASEVAARFYSACGSETSANAYLRNARYCYLRWGAEGKVRQLDRLYPHLAGPEGQYAGAAMGSAIQHLDVASVVKASQAVSGEIELVKLINRLMRIALENAGADRGLLMLPARNEYLIQAEARTADDQIEVRVCQEPITPIACPETLVRYVIRTRESVILDDASKPNLFSADFYLRDRQPMSILCLPLIKQGELTGILLLENAQTSHAFTSARIAILELLAAQAAISLENTRLYGDLRDREAKVRRLVDANIIGISIIDLRGEIIEANDAFLNMLGYEREDLASGRMPSWTDLTPSEWRAGDEKRVDEVRMTGTLPPFEKEYFHKDGRRVPALVGVARIDETGNQAVAFVIDLTERKRAEENLHESERRNVDAQMQLAHVNRISTLGQLTASIAHEVNQPLAANLINAGTALRWLNARPPNLERAKRSVGLVIEDGKRAADIVGRIRDLVKNAPTRQEASEINNVISKVIELIHYETSKNSIVVKTRLADGLPRIWADRVQLPQVILNLIMNAIEAMTDVDEEARELLISTSLAESGGVLVAVRDSGSGLPSTNPERIFDAFYTTKSAGLGMGLSICRSIIEAHGGRLWSEPNEPRGAVFFMMLPLGQN
jgi:PAS domain S-box-containing protein